MAQAVPPPPSPIDVLVMACRDKTCNFQPMRAQRRACGDGDVVIDMKYCGICHSDTAAASGRFPIPTTYPIVPGHELAGIVSQVGSKVTKFSVGDKVGVGCWVDSCLSCKECKAGREQWCKKDGTLTYNSKDKHKRASFAACKCGDAPVQRTMGGYTNIMVVHERFAIKIPKSLPLEAAGPIMCSGVTVYEPMKEHGLQPGMKLAVIGLGGLGLTAIKIGNALGALVTAVSRGTKKAPLAKDAGAKWLVDSTRAGYMRNAAGSFDLILDTVPMSHDPHGYYKLLKPKGKYVFLGANEQFIGTMIASKLFCCGSGDFRISNTGSIKNTQEIVELCDQHKILPNTRIIPVSEVNSAITEIEKGNDDGIRFVLDLGTLSNYTLENWKDQAPPTLNANEKAPNSCNACWFCCKISCCCKCCCMAPGTPFGNGSGEKLGHLVDTE